MYATRGSPFGSPRTRAGSCQTAHSGDRVGELTSGAHDLPTTQIGCVYALTFWLAKVKSGERKTPNNWSTLWAVADVAHGALELRRGHNNCSGVLDVFDVAAASV